MRLQVADALHDFFGTTTAPDCSVECVGVHYTKSWRHKLELLAGVRLRRQCHARLALGPARQLVSLTTSQRQEEDKLR